MPRKKKTSFKLNPEWLLKEPVDFEYNKYTLLDYLQKCEKNLDNLEIYPDFVEISLHLANIQSIVKENILLSTNKKFESCDDEILLKELVPIKLRELTKDEETELEKTLKYSGNKLFDFFNIAKSIWNLAFDNIELVLKKNKNNIISGSGYIFYLDIGNSTLYLWEYQIKKPKGDNQNNKTYLTKLYEGTPKDVTLSELIDKYSTLNKSEFYKDLPVFELRVFQKFPMEQTIVPMIKRKVMSYVFQVVNYEKSDSFDSEK